MTGWKNRALQVPPVVPYKALGLTTSNDAQMKLIKINTSLIMCERSLT